MRENLPKQKAWRELMRGEQGLLVLQQQLLQEYDAILASKLSNVRALVPLCRKLSNMAPQYVPDEREDQTGFAKKSLNASGIEFDSQRYVLEEKIAVNSLDDVVPTVYVSSQQDTAENRLARSLFTTTALMIRITKNIVYKSDFYNPQTESQERRNLYSLYTDLASPQAILQDSIQTCADLFRITCRECRSLDEQEAAMRVILEDRPDGTIYVGNRSVQLNPFKQTQAELWARAPFGIMATLRQHLPVAIDGEPVYTTQAGFSNNFLYWISRSKIKDFYRHGGCPVLHEEAGSELIAQLGYVFVRAHKEISSRIFKEL